MSDTERLTLRDLPPVEPVPLPQRYSQTLLNRANSCRRSAYLYVRHGGGTPAVELDFGTAFHLFAERALLELIVNGEDKLYSLAEGEDPVHAAKQVASMTAAMCDEILREHRELTLPARGTHSRDKLRELAFHWAIACDIKPAQVVGVERKFVLDLDCGITVSGKIDVATFFEDPRWGGVDDYKTGFNLPPQGDYEDSFQTARFYPLLLMFGQPVEMRGDEEVRLEPVGEYLQYVRARELYPRLRPTDDGFLRERKVVVSRQEISDFKHDLEELAVEMGERFETWKFPAVPGSHCSTCACRPECPLPPHLRRHAGTIETLEQAQEAAEWVDTNGAEVAATKKELRSFANVHGPFRFGRDKIYEFGVSEKWSTEWEALEDAVERARLYGEPFDLGAYRRMTTSTSFRSRKLTAEELEPTVTTDDSEVRDGEDDPAARWGETAPF